MAARSAVKRAMDIAGAIGGLVFLSPLLALVAFLVRWESRGPILFRQPRTGRNGQIFVCLKFRTMVPDAEQRLRDLEARNESVGGVLFKIKDDPMVTPLGRFLRRSSLDELPQLWNVLVGEMSLVGPRPLLALEIALCDACQARRLLVRPGITGLSQINGRNAIPWADRIEWDLLYVEDMSLGLDLLILLRTVPTALLGRTAYAPVPDRGRPRSAGLRPEPSLASQVS
jgi:lipopolysaccharide/colanic/teichoic acid biosynthesis glycosyltransferase